MEYFPLTSEHIVENGRINLPARLKRRLFELNIKSVIISRGFDDCLYLHLPEDWNNFVDKLNKLPKAGARGLIRKLMFGAEEVKIDKQGRLLIPPLLREYAGISKEVILIKLPDRLEIWDKERLLDYDSKTSFEELSNKFDESGNGK